MTGLIAGGLAAAGAVAGAGLSFAGAKSAQSQSKKAQALAFNFERKRIRRLAKDARKAGIHPLAALGSGAASAYQNPYAVNGGGYGNAGMEFGQDILSAGVNFANEWDQKKAEQAAAELENHRWEATHDLNRAKTEAEIRLLESQTLRNKLDAKRWAQNGNFANPDSKWGSGTLPNATIPGGTKEELPAYDVEAFERRYGELGNWTAGAGNMVSDGYHRAERAADRIIERVMDAIPEKKTVKKKPATRPQGWRPR